MTPSSRTLFAIVRGALWGNLVVTILWAAYLWWAR